MVYDTVSESDTIKNIVLYFDWKDNRIDVGNSENKKGVVILDSLFANSPKQKDIISIDIVTWSSPEGSSDFNIRLADERSRLTKEFLQKRYSFSDKMNIQLLPGGEDWSRFRWLVANDHEIPDREEVLILIDKHSNDLDKCKMLLHKLDRGIPYRYMAEYLYPRLRRSVVSVVRSNTEKEEVASSITASTSDTTRRTVEPMEHPVLKTIGTDYMRDTIQSREFLVEEVDDHLGKSKTILAVKNNLLYDLALAPNIEVEIPIGRWWSLNTEYKCPWWLNSRRGFCYQLLSGGIEGRYWLGNRFKRDRLSGHFLGLYAEGGIYDFQFGEEAGYQGKYYGAAGLTYGYGWKLARHFSMEFSLGVGYLTTEYRKYTPYEGDIVWKENGKYNFIGPTKLKVSLVWLINTRR